MYAVARKASIRDIVLGELGTGVGGKSIVEGMESLKKGGA